MFRISISGYFGCLQSANTLDVHVERESFKRVVKYFPNTKRHSIGGVMLNVEQEWNLYGNGCEFRKSLGISILNASVILNETKPNVLKWL